jgi:hypothetical protein
VGRLHPAWCSIIQLNRTLELTVSIKLELGSALNLVAFSGPFKAEIHAQQSKLS